MPKESGVDLFLSLRAEGVEVPFVLMSGFAGDLAAELSDVPRPEHPQLLQKPFRLDAFEEAVAKATAAKPEAVTQRSAG